MRTEQEKQEENRILIKAEEMGTQSLSPQEFEKLESAIHWMREARGLNKTEKENVPLNARVKWQGRENETKVIAFNKTNEAIKQDGIAPDMIIFCGKIEDVPEAIIYEHFGTYKDFFYECRDAKEDEEYCIIVKEPLSI